MVFISYSHDTDDLCDKVLNLSNNLREFGVDCNIDQYEESPPEGWPRWMESQIREAEYVLVVCTKQYLDKAILKVHKDTGLGVKWETNLILNQLYATGAVTNKFIPIVFNNSDVESILDPLKGQTYYNLEYPAKLEQLRNRLLGIKQNKKPSLGSIPRQETKVAKPDARMLITGVIDIETWDKAKWTGVGYAFDFSNPPLLGIWHKDINSSIKIFSDWIQRFGRIDKNEEIYISLIEDDNSDSYSVHIGADFEGINKRLKESGIEEEFNYFIQMDRWHRMQLVDKKYLATFKEQYSKYGCYDFVPMKNVNGKIQPIMDLSIRKKNIRFRKFSELVDKETDYDYLAIELREEQDS